MKNEKLLNSLLAAFMLIIAAILCIFLTKNNNHNEYSWFDWQECIKEKCKKICQSKKFFSGTMSNYNESAVECECHSEESLKKLYYSPYKLGCKFPDSCSNCRK